MRSAVVTGRGAVERKAAQWVDGTASIHEAMPRLWHVRDGSGAMVGVIAKEPWGADALAATVARVEDIPRVVVTSEMMAHEYDHDWSCSVCDGCNREPYEALDLRTLQPGEACAAEAAAKALGLETVAE